MQHIFVPSKNRATTATVPRILDRENVPYTLVVEPQDEKAYREQFPSSDIHVLDKNDMNVAYCRRSIKARSLSLGEKAHWQLDDNILSFRRRVGTRNKVTNVVEVLPAVEDFCDKFSNIGIAGLSYATYAFSAKQDVSINRVISSAQLIFNQVPVQWRDGVIDDTDYSLQVLKNGYCTLLFNRLLCDKAATESFKGGLTEFYQSGGRVAQWKRLCVLWPGWFRVTKQGNRYKLHPSRIWQSFPQRPRVKITTKPVENG
jgi:hypothetical protein